MSASERRNFTETLASGGGKAVIRDIAVEDVDAHETDCGTVLRVTTLPASR